MALELKRIVGEQVGIAFEIFSDLIETVVLLKDSSGSRYNVETGVVEDIEDDIVIEGIFINQQAGDNSISKNLYVYNSVGAQGEGYQLLIRNLDDVYNKLFVNDTIKRQDDTYWVLKTLDLDPTRNFISCTVERKR